MRFSVVVLKQRFVLQVLTSTCQSSEEETIRWDGGYKAKQTWWSQEAYSIGYCVRLTTSTTSTQLESKDNKVRGSICTKPPVGFWKATPSDDLHIGRPVKQDLSYHVKPTTPMMHERLGRS
ncbi:hypothetical protein C5167_023271 [Papaver somniferum]|uniref:Secreted protein n=1 Tax=Papaver somniferum TaxID=3469 RepID=A0A4Y7JN96_PAPSO|nr:hypothetical protein C5167_023271 [Papaver somniferum]